MSNGALDPSTIAQTIGGLRRGWREFLRLPTIILVAFVVLSAVTYLLDRPQSGWADGLQEFLGRRLFQDEEATRGVLTTVATSLITVSSITFSVLLLAAQQAASAMTQEVLDQFLRRKLNQAFFGFFAGVSVFALITLATVSPEHNPIFGATVALAATIVGLCLIVVLVYSTLYQMRPAVIVQGIHDLTLSARSSQADLVRETSAPRDRKGEQCTDVLSGTDGYIVDVNLGRVLRAIEGAGERVEVDLLQPIGGYVAHGDSVARIYCASDETAEHLSTEVQRSIDLADDRSIDFDPSFGIEQLMAIAWTSISTSKQSPSPGIRVSHSLRDILARLVSDDHALERSPDSPVSYPDTLMEEVFEAFEELGVVSSESMQAQQFATLAETFTGLYSRMPSDCQARMEEATRRLLPALGDHVLSRRLDTSLAGLSATLRAAGRTGVADEVEAARRGLAATVGQLRSRATRA